MTYFLCFPSVFDAEHSNSSWAELQPLVIGSYSLHPLTNSMKQRLILQYLTPLGDYHEVKGLGGRNNVFFLSRFSPSLPPSLSLFLSTASVLRNLQTPSILPTVQISQTLHDFIIKLAMAVWSFNQISFSK